jgi:hypothetical protein
MTDRREAILSQLVTVCGGIAGVNAVDRNRLDVSAMLRPAVIILDGLERLVTAQPTSTGSPTVSQKQRMELLPQIIIVLRGDSGGEAGALLTLFRNRILAAILNDATLLGTVTVNGGIRYEGCVVPPPDAEAREYRIDLNLVFTYVFSLGDLG